MRHSNRLVACPSVIPRTSPAPGISRFDRFTTHFFMHQGGRAIYPVVKSLNSRDHSPGLYFNPAAQGKKEIHVN